MIALIGILSLFYLKWVTRLLFNRLQRGKSNLVSAAKRLTHLHLASETLSSNLEETNFGWNQNRIPSYLVKKIIGETEPEICLHMDQGVSKKAIFYPTRGQGDNSIQQRCVIQIWFLISPSAQANEDYSEDLQIVNLDELNDSASNTDTRIIGGQPVNIERYPYTVQVHSIYTNII